LSFKAATRHLSLETPAGQFFDCAARYQSSVCAAYL
jgi:hypothetical protein